MVMNTTAVRMSVPIVQAQTVKQVTSHSTLIRIPMPVTATGHLNVREQESAHFCRTIDQQHVFILYAYIYGKSGNSAI